MIYFIIALLALICAFWYVVSGLTKAMKDEGY